MTEEKLEELLKKVSSMSFEEGRHYILSNYKNVIERTNTDYDCFNESFNNNEGLFDADFCFDEDNDELILTFTTGCKKTDEVEEGEIINFDDGYWNIQGVTLYYHSIK